MPKAGKSEKSKESKESKDRNSLDGWSDEIKSESEKKED